MISPVCLARECICKNDEKRRSPISARQLSTQELLEVLRYDVVVSSTD